MIDIHNHILPAWDDGPTTIYDTYTMARQAVGAGTTIMVATPHRTWDGRFSTPERVEERVTLLNEELKSQDIKLEIVSGVEIPISGTIVDELAQGNIKTLGTGNYVLVEPPFPSLPDYLLPSIDFILENGYSVVLAHPERNSVVQKQWSTHHDLSFVKSCADRGCVIQLTSGSIVGRFGKTAMDVCKAIAGNRQWRIVIASDSHDTVERTPGLLAKARDVVAGWIGDSLAASDMVESLPREIIGR